MLTFPPSPQVRIFVAREPVDMRKGFDGLAGVVIDVVDHDPQSGHLFLFFNRRRDRMKALLWEASGFWVLYKRLEHGRFHVFDRAGESKYRFEISAAEIALVLDGIDLRGSRRRVTHDDMSARA
ncbi:MAG: IS66 family insertion sequence element accessory protein TnpB [Planctomycetota bacterium]